MIKISIILLVIFNFSYSTPYFDGELAFEYLKKQCEFGPRYPGSEAHKSLKNYFIKFLEPYADEILVHEHKQKHPYNGNDITLYNLLARYNMDSKNRILLLAHWDTRDIADKEENVVNQDKPILGANDGASGIAILMVLSQILHDSPLKNIGVDLLFVDGEDMGRHGEIDNFCLGTKAFAKDIKLPHTRLAIGLDMVADKDPEFKKEYFSYIQSKKELDEIWLLAQNLGYDEFNDSLTGAIYDDHRAFYLATGIPSINIIDFDYPFWHTLDDTVDKCSANTLSIVGNVVCEYIYRKDEE